MKPINLILLACSIFLSTLCNAQPYGYAYGKTITINASQVVGSTNLIDFPVLLKLVDSDLRSVNNGGKVYNRNGFDIVFTMSDCSISLYHQIEKYDSLTGELHAWVRIPSLSPSSNTTIHMYYGNSSISSTNSSSSTWNNDYVTVHHLNQDPSSAPPQMLDQSTENNHGNCNGGMNIGNSVTGISGNGLSFDELDDHVVIGDFDYTNSNSFMTSFWFKVSNNSGNSYQYMISHGAYGTNNSFNTYFGEASLGIPADQHMLKTVFQDANDATNPNALDAGNTFADGNWHFYCFKVSSAGNPKIFIDGNFVSNITFQGGDSFNPATDIYLGSRSDLNATRFFGGTIDEFRILNDTVSDEWILTEFNNISSPSTFYSTSSEFPSGSICVPLPIELLSFEVYPSNSKEVNIEWTTASEINNDYFQIEKSQDGVNWTFMKQIDGAGNSYSILNYKDLDANPYLGISYYRLKQVDFNGDYSYSPIKSVNFEGIEIINTYPNPSSDIINVTINSHSEINILITLTSVDGKLVYSNSLGLGEGFSTFPVSIRNLESGSYILKVQSENNLYYDQKQIKVSNN